MFRLVILLLGSRAFWFYGVCLYGYTMGLVEFFISREVYVFCWFILMDVIPFYSYSGLIVVSIYLEAAAELIF